MRARAPLMRADTRVAAIRKAAGWKEGMACQTNVSRVCELRSDHLRALFMRCRSVAAALALSPPRDGGPVSSIIDASAAVTNDALHLLAT